MLGNLESAKKEAKRLYIAACNEWMETRTPENINGDFEKWKVVCECRRNCMLLGVII